MRLRAQDRERIKQIAREVFGPGTRVFLFGSRVDPHRKGGDVDLYVIPAVREDLFDRKLTFLARLKLQLGDRKIDVVLAEDPSRPIEQVALQEGIEL
ncbi:nucleotidyltransferase domain-containing protein [Rhodothermus marinus]|uniref:nucleotidyltransferase domain-containing protein n=1 Tax=Rhodothermus marinus TaxID=29549 RepID=UPI0006D1B6B0|nr:nucleotidyltransferase domain-containing protein [Rhodothermus marinus]